MNKIIFISDIDGCLTDGGLYYSDKGKIVKRFSAGDHEGLKFLKHYGIDVVFITADKTGLPITKQRIKDMSNSELVVYNEKDRFNYIKELKEKYDTVILFGDGLGDANVKLQNACDMFICPKQSRLEVKNEADYVTEYEGGHGALLDAALWLIKKLFNKTRQDIFDFYTK